MEFGFYFSSDVHRVHRSVYNSFMLLGDVGGLFSLLFSISTTLLGVVNFQTIENTLVSDLYHFRDSKEEEKIEFNSKN